MSGSEGGGKLVMVWRRTHRGGGGGVTTGQPQRVKTHALFLLKDIKKKRCKTAQN
jgi:hypothetical protein